MFSLPFDLIKELCCYLSYRTSRRFLTMFSNINSEEVWKYKIRNELCLSVNSYNSTVLPLHIRYLELKSCVYSDFGTDLFYYMTFFCPSLTEKEVLELFENFKASKYFPENLCMYYINQKNADKFIETYTKHKDNLIVEGTNDLYTMALNSGIQKIIEFLQQTCDTEEINITKRVLYYINGNLNFILDDIKNRDYYLYRYYQLVKNKHWSIIDYLISQNYIEDIHELYEGLISIRDIDKIKYYFEICKYNYDDSILLLEFCCDSGLVEIVDIVNSYMKFDKQVLSGGFEYCIEHNHLDIAIYLHDKLKQQNIEIDFSLEQLLNKLIEKVKQFD